MYVCMYIYVKSNIMRTSCDLCLYDCGERISKVNLSVYSCIGSKYVPTSHLKYASCCRSMYAEQQNSIYPLSQQQSLHTVAKYSDSKAHCALHRHQGTAEVR